MKTKWRVFCAAAALLAGLNGCAGPAGSREPAGPAPLKIGVALYKQDDTFISTIQQNMEQRAREMEAEKGIKITLNVVDGKGSQGVQNDQVDKFLAQRYDVVCVNMVDRTAAAVIVDKAKAAGIPVIFFNREPVEEDIARWDRAYYVGTNASQSGILEGEIVADLYERDPARVDKNGDGVLQYVMLEGEPGHQDALIRTEYAVKSITARGIRVEKLANDTANWQRAQGSARMAQWLEEFGGGIEVVISNNDDMALGAIDACRSAGLPALPVVVGVDATPPALQAVREGALAGTVVNDSEGQARAIMALCYALATGGGTEGIEGLEGHYVRMPHRAITPQALAREGPEGAPGR